MALPVYRSEIAMSRAIPIRDLADKIIGFRNENEPDPVQATLDASMKAVGGVER
jgi:hypothetical protein